VNFAHSGVGALKNSAEEPDEQILAELSIDSVKVDKLVKEFLTAQTLTILPQNSFGDAVSQFVDKDDKHAMETFVKESLTTQLKHLMEANEVEEEEIVQEMAEYREQLEDLFASGQLKKVPKSKTKPKPDGWDSDFEGSWADQPGALIRSDNEGEKDDDESLASIPTKKSAPRGRGKAAGTTRQSAAAAKKAAPAAKGGRGKKKVVEEEEEDEEESNDVIMIDDDDDEEESGEDLFVASQRKAPTKKTVAKATKAPARARSPSKKTTTTRTKASATQSKLNFSQTPTQRSQPPRPTASRGKKAVQEPVSDNPPSNPTFTC
jgi:double-strand break repair protein MRE11